MAQLPFPEHPTAEEQITIDQCILFAEDGSFYHHLQTTRPQTIGYALADSPVGQAAWIYEKLGAWSDNQNGPEEAFSYEQMLDNIMFYWLTNSSASSARMYAEHPGLNFGAVPVDIPVAVSVFPREIYTPPRSWAERTYSQMIYWNRPEKPVTSALDTLRDAGQALAASRAEPVGRVRIDLPAGFGRLLLPSLQKMRERYPKLILELALTDRMSDPVSEGWDIIVRIGELPSDSELTVRKLCDTKQALYASPEYLAKRGAINSIADLNLHDALVFRSQASGRLRDWELQDGDQTRNFIPTPVLILSDGQALVEAIQLGLGVAHILDRVALPHVQAGRLVHLLPEADVPGPPVHAIIPLGAKMTAKTRAVLNYLVDELRTSR